MIEKESLNFLTKTHTHSHTLTHTLLFYSHLLHLLLRKLLSLLLLPIYPALKKILINESKKFKLGKDFFGEAI